MPQKRTTVLHFSDLHLATSFPWAGAEAGRARRRELAQTLEALIDLALEVDADAIVSVGDLYDAGRAGPQTAELLRRAFERAQPRMVVLLPGNSDPPGPGSLYQHTAWSSNVRVAVKVAAEPFAIGNGVRLWAGSDFSESAPEGDGGVHLAAFHGEPPEGFAHVLGGGRHTAEDGDGFTFPGTPAQIDLEGSDGAAVLYRISAEGGVQRERRQVSRGSIPAALPAVAEWLEVKPEETYDLSVLSEEQTVRGEFLRDLLAGDLTPVVARRALAAGLRALESELPEVR